MNFKTYFNLLVEATREDIKKFYPQIDIKDYNTILDSDPTGTKNKVGGLSRLVLDLHKKQKLKLDKEILHDIFAAFDTVQKKKDSLTGTEFEKYRDLSAIPDADVLLDIKHYLDQKTSGKIKLKANEGENIDVFYESDNWKVLIPLDYKSSVKLGRKYNANWCTASSNAAIHYNRYIVENDLFIIVNKKTDEAHQYYNNNDDIEFNNKKNINVDIYSFVEKNPETSIIFKMVEEQSVKNSKNPNRLFERYQTSESLYLVIAAIENDKIFTVDRMLKIIDKRKRDEKILIKDNTGAFRGGKEYTTINTELYLKGHNIPYTAELIGLLCKKYDIEYTLNDDLSIDTNGPVYFSGSHKLTKIPIKFNKVEGAFIMENTGISTLENAPKHVTYNFQISNNKLTSLKGGPIEVGNHYICSENPLVSLEGTPKKIPGDFICSRCKLTSLKGGPEEVGGFFKCRGNELVSLKGAPKKAEEGFDCCNNKVVFSEEDVRKVCEVNGAIRTEW